jgi:pyridoxine kinase
MVVDLYRTSVVPIADVLTPNQFECELLTEMQIDTVADALQACKALHARGPSVVVISSFQEERADGSVNTSELVVIGSKATLHDGEIPTTYEQYEIRVPHIDSYYTGTGDLFAALLLAWLNKLPSDFQQVLENVLSTIQSVLQITLRLGGRNCELKLIQSRHVIAHPLQVVTATALSG